MNMIITNDVGIQLTNGTINMNMEMATHVTHSGLLLLKRISFFKPVYKPWIISYIYVKLKTSLVVYPYPNFNGSLAEPSVK